VAACQRRCLGVLGCMHFSYFNATQNCHLQDAFAISAPSTLGFVSGPFSCQGIRPGQEGYVHVGHEALHPSYLPRDLACLQVGTDYVPDLGVPCIFTPEQDADHGIMGMNTIRNCQRKCNLTKGCEHFSVQFPTGFCKLASASAKFLGNMIGAVSGPRAGCDAASTESPDAVEGIMVKDTEGITVKDSVDTYQVKGTVGTHLARLVEGNGSIALVALSMLAIITAAAVRLLRRPYSRLEDPSAPTCEPSLGLLV